MTSKWVAAALALAILAMLLVVRPSHAEDVPEEFIGLVVKKIEVVAPIDFSKSRIRRLSAIKKGSPLTYERISRTLERVYLNGRVQDVKIWAERLDDGLLVRIEAVPLKMIREMIFWGNFQFSSDELKEITGVARGDGFWPELLPELKERLLEAYRQEGYFEAEVKVAASEATEKNEVDLTFTIKEGPRYWMGELHVRGRPTIPEDKIARKLGWKRGRRFRQEKFESKLEKLESYFRRRGYMEVRITKPRFRLDREKKRVDAYVRIYSGKDVKVTFEGDFTPWQRRQSMPKELNLKKTRRMNRWVALEMEEKIKAFFARKGYAEVEVETFYSEDEESKLVLFAAILGEKYKVAKVEFEGNRFATDKELLKALKPPKRFERSDFRTILSRIVRLYNERGFLLAAAELESVHVDVEKRELVITVGVVEGPRIILDELRFEGARKYKPKKLRELVEIEEGAPLNPFLLNELTGKIAAKYLEEGYLRVRVNWEVEGDCEKPEGDCVLPVVVKLDEGKRYYYGNTYIRGLRLSRREIVERELFELRKGEPFRQDQILSVEQALLLTPYFKGVRVERLTLDEDDTEIDLAVEVRERDCGYAEVGLGYDSVEKFKGSLELGHKNLGGYGRMLSFHTDVGIADESLELTEHTMNLHFVWPWVTQYPMTGVMDLFDRMEPYPSFTLRSTGTSVGLNTNLEKLFRRMKSTRGRKELVRLVKFYSASITYQIQEDFVFDVEQGAEEDKGRLRLASISPQLVRDSRDDPFHPLHGQLTSVTTEFSNRTLGSDSNYLKLMAQHGIYQRLGDFISPLGDLVLAVNARLGFAWPFWPNTELPIQKRYFLGGRTTVRGFGESEIAPRSDGDPVGGNFVYLTNVELRIPLEWSLGTLLFWDSGAVTESYEEFDFGEVRDTAGFGLYYLTPVGPLSAITGFKLDRRHYESAGEFYITIGHAF